MAPALSSAACIIPSGPRSKLRHQSQAPQRISKRLLLNAAKWLADCAPGGSLRARNASRQRHSTKQAALLGTKCIDGKHAHLYAAQLPQQVAGTRVLANLGAVPQRMARTVATGGSLPDRPACPSSPRRQSQAHAKAAASTIEPPHLNRTWTSPSKARTGGGVPPRSGLPVPAPAPVFFRPSSRGATSGSAQKAAGMSRKQELSSMATRVAGISRSARCAVRM
jgi:hypothetical protein